MYCQKCNAENADDAHRCLTCGYEFAHVSAAVAARASRAAIAALVLGILAFLTCGITVLPAIICGIVALVKISGSNGLLKGKGMAITGLVLPGVFVVLLPIFAIFASIMVPAFTKARDQTKTIVCRSNLRQLSLGVQLYIEDNDGEFPTATEWSLVWYDSISFSRALSS